MLRIITCLFIAGMTAPTLVFIVNFNLLQKRNAGMEIAIVDGIVFLFIFFILLHFTRHKRQVGKEDLRIEIRRAGDVVIFDLFGKITLGQSSVCLRNEIWNVIQQGYNNILLNFEEVTQIDSAGLGELKVGMLTLKSELGALKGVSANNIKDVGELARFIAVMDCYESEADALSSFN